MDELWWIHGLLVQKRWKKQKDAFGHPLEPPKENQPWRGFKVPGHPPLAAVQWHAERAQRPFHAVTGKSWPIFIPKNSMSWTFYRQILHVFLRMLLFSRNGFSFDMFYINVGCREKKGLYRNSWVGQITQDIGGNQCNLHTKRLGFFKTNDLFLKNIYKTVSCSDS